MQLALQPWLWWPLLQLHPTYVMKSRPGLGVVPLAQVTHQPPELLREGLLSKAADVYALGILLWSVSECSTVGLLLQSPRMLAMLLL